MVAAVFHMPLEASAPPAASPTSSPIAKAMTASQARPAAAPPAPKKPAIDLRSFWMAVLPPVLRAFGRPVHSAPATAADARPQPWRKLG